MDPGLFWHSGTLALSNERQSARMSKIKNAGLDQYSAESFEEQQYGTAGVEAVKPWKANLLHVIGQQS